MISLVSSPLRGPFSIYLGHPTTRYHLLHVRKRGGIGTCMKLDLYVDYLNFSILVGSFVLFGKQQCHILRCDIISVKISQTAHLVYVRGEKSHRKRNLSHSIKKDKIKYYYNMGTS